MSYEKQTWVTGETITAEKLNHMEGGISDSDILILTYDSQAETYSHTVEECKAAMLNGKIVVFFTNDDGDYSIGIASLTESDTVYFSNINGAFIETFAYHGNTMESVSEGTVVPYPSASDIGKVLKVVSDGTGNAKLSWETL